MKCWAGTPLLVGQQPQGRQPPRKLFEYHGVGIEMQHAHDRRVRWRIHRFPDGDAVGTPVTRRPPHRPGRAELPHPVLALGRDSKPPIGEGVSSAHGRDKLPRQALEPFPGDGPALAAAAERLTPGSTHSERKPSRRNRLPGTAKYSVVPPEDLPQPVPYFLHRIVSSPLEDCPDRRQCRTHALLNC